MKLTSVLKLSAGIVACSLMIASTAAQARLSLTGAQVRSQVIQPMSSVSGTNYANLMAIGEDKLAEGLNKASENPANEKIILEYMAMVIRVANGDDVIGDLSKQERLQAIGEVIETMALAGNQVSGDFQAFVSPASEVGKAMNAIPGDSSLENSEPSFINAVNIIDGTGKKLSLQSLRDAFAGQVQEVTGNTVANVVPACSTTVAQTGAATRD